jgi:hypothetical protein
MIKSQHVAANVIHVRDGSAITTIYICSLKEKLHLKGGKITPKRWKNRNRVLRKTRRKFLVLRNQKDYKKVPSSEKLLLETNVINAGGGQEYQWRTEKTNVQASTLQNRDNTTYNKIIIIIIIII